MRTMGTLRLETIADLKAAPVAEGQVVLLVGGMSLGDGRGGFYRWSAASTTAEEMTFLNVVLSDRSTSGRWLRIFQRARKLAHGVLVNNGGVRTFYADGVTDANGQATVNLTEENTPGGTALFAEIWSSSGEAKSSGPTANDSIIGSRKVVANDLKTITYQFNRGATTTLASSLTGILGLLVPGLRAAPPGTAVTIRIDGI